MEKQTAPKGNQQKKLYAAPELTVYGDVEKLTQKGAKVVGTVDDAHS